jgi:hypothetical protein
MGNPASGKAINDDDLAAVLLSINTQANELLAGDWTAGGGCHNPTKVFITMTIDELNQIHGTWRSPDPIRGNRPDFFGTVAILSDTITGTDIKGTITFPDDAPFPFTLDRNAKTITWTNNTTWIRTPDTSNHSSPISEQGYSIDLDDPMLKELDAFLLGYASEESNDAWPGERSPPAGDLTLHVNGVKFKAGIQPAIIQPAVIQPAVIQPKRENNPPPSSVGSCIGSPIGSCIGSSVASGNARPRKWMPEEDAMLSKAVARFGVMNWTAVAGDVNTRNRVQCQQRWTKAIRPGLSKGRWTTEEDETLLRFVCQCGTDWPKVAQLWPTAFAPGSSRRTIKQIRERYSNKLDPRISRVPWTADEDRQIMELQERFGNNWPKLASHLPGRVAEGIKTRFKTVFRREQKAEEERRLRQAQQQPQ